MRGSKYVGVCTKYYVELEIHTRVRKKCEKISHRLMYASPNISENFKKLCFLFLSFLVSRQANNHNARDSLLGTNL